MSDTLTAFAQAKIRGLDEQALLRTLKPTRRLDGAGGFADGIPPPDAPSNAARLAGNGAAGGTRASR